MNGYILNYPIEGFAELIQMGIQGGETVSDSEGYSGEIRFPFYIETITVGGRKKMEVNPQLLKEISKRLGLLYIAEKEGGNVCFVTENEELRDEYKIGFVIEDIYHYTYGRWTVVQEVDEHSTENICIPYPDDQDTFWHYVNLGKEELKRRYGEGKYNIM